MVCNNPDRLVTFLLFSVFLMGNPAYAVPDRLYRVDVKNRIHTLHNHRQTFQPHAGIYIFVIKFLVISVPIVIKLRKYIVPDLNIAVTVTADCTSRLAAAIFLPAVKINLGRWPARPCPVLPKIILFAKTENPLFRHSDLLIPNIKRLIILFIYRRIKQFLRNFQNLCQKFP